MSFIYDHQIPARPQQALSGVFDNRDPRNRCDDLIPFLPRILSVVGSQDIAADDIELLTEFVRQFPLPLEREVGRCDDQNSANKPTCFEFLQQESGHDRLSRSGIIRQQESNPGEFQEVAVNSFQLMRQRIDAGNGERKEWVVFIRQSQAVSFHPKTKQPRIPVERFTVR